MENTIINFLQKHNININKQKVCIGISTGIDSSVLLHCLLKLQKKLNMEIILCHVNHNKREQSKEEEQYIINYAKENNLVLEILHLDLSEIENENFQAAARMKRLQFFNDVMNKYHSKYLFLAHHLNDDIETSFMHIIRGSNLKGYSGIDEVVINKDNKYILRPFLTILKEDIVKYALDNNVKYYEDSSNASNDYTRNRIRHYIIPEIFKENNNFEKQFLEFKDTLLNSYNIVCDIRDEFIKNNITINEENIIFDLECFNMLSDFMKTEVLFAILKKYQLSKVNIKEIIKYTKTSKANLIIDYKNIHFCKQYNKIIISNQKESIPSNNISITIDKLGIYDINDKYYLEVKKFDKKDLQKKENILINLNVIWYNSSMLPIELRTKRTGDIIKINNGSKKVKDLLIDEKVPLNMRNELLMLVKNKEIINIFGVKKSSTLLAIKENDILIELREKEKC